MFYAPEGSLSSNNGRVTPTEFVKIRPTAGDPTIVRRSDAFEISFVGMSVTPEDTTFKNTHDLLLYSMKTCPNVIPDDTIDDDGENVTAARRRPINGEGHSVSDEIHSELTDDDVPIVPTSGFSLSPDDIPFIHYDPVVDRRDGGSVPNLFVRVPESKALFHQHRGDCTRQRPVNGLASVSLRFNVLEIDHVSDGQARSAGSVGELSKLVNTSGIPYLQPLSMAASATSALGKEGRKNYLKPDHVMAKDLVFMLAEPEDDDNTSRSGSSTSGSSRVETYGNFLRVSCIFFDHLMAHCRATIWRVMIIMMMCCSDEISYVFTVDILTLCGCALLTCCAVVYGAL